MERINDTPQKSKSTPKKHPTVMNMWPGKSMLEDLPEQLDLPFGDEEGGDSGG